jgi:hypothetical protein
MCIGVLQTASHQLFSGEPKKAPLSGYLAGSFSVTLLPSASPFFYSVPNKQQLIYTL